MNYNENTKKCQVLDTTPPNTWLVMKFKEDISEELGSTVPYPQKHYVNNLWVYSWLLDGYFGTKDSIEFLNDIIARFIISFPGASHYKHYTDTKTTITPLKLKQFQNLKSRATQIVNNNYRFDGTTDFIFWCLKLHAELLIKEKGIFSFDELLNYAMSNFVDKAKDRSTLKAKCSNIFRWYLDRDFEIPKRREKKPKGEVMATRQEHAKKMTKQREEKAKRKVLNLITGMFKDEYRKKDGSWNVSKITKESGTNRRTVMKYLPKETLFKGETK
jgi:hypothetical protein